MEEKRGRRLGLMNMLYAGGVLAAGYWYFSEIRGLSGLGSDAGGSLTGDFLLGWYVLVPALILTIVHITIGVSVLAKRSYAKVVLIPLFVAWFLSMAVYLVYLGKDMIAEFVKSPFSGSVLLAMFLTVAGFILIAADGLYLSKGTRS